MDFVNNFKSYSKTFGLLFFGHGVQNSIAYLCCILLSAAVDSVCPHFHITFTRLYVSPTSNNAINNGGWNVFSVVLKRDQMDTLYPWWPFANLLSAAAAAAAASLRSNDVISRSERLFHRWLKGKHRGEVCMETIVTSTRGTVAASGSLEYLIYYIALLFIYSLAFCQLLLNEYCRSCNLVFILCCICLRHRSVVSSSSQVRLQSSFPAGGSLLASDGWRESWRPPPQGETKSLVLVKDKDGRLPRGPPGGGAYITCTSSVYAGMVQYWGLLGWTYLYPWKAKLVIKFCLSSVILDFFCAFLPC